MSPASPGRLPASASPEPPVSRLCAARAWSRTSRRGCPHRSAAGALGTERSDPGKEGRRPMSQRCGTVADFRSLYAACIAAAGRRRDRPLGNAFEVRLEGAFEAIPRELFLPPGPWHLMTPAGVYIATPGADPCYL